MLAGTQGHLPVVQLLVESGASVLAEDEDGHTPLHLTFLRPHSETSHGRGSRDQVTR